MLCLFLSWYSLSLYTSFSFLFLYSLHLLLSCDLFSLWCSCFVIFLATLKSNLVYFLRKNYLDLPLIYFRFSFSHFCFHVWIFVFVFEGFLLFVLRQCLSSLALSSVYIESLNCKVDTVHASNYSSSFFSLNLPYAHLKHRHQGSCFGIQTPFLFSSRMVQCSFLWKRPKYLFL